MLEWVDLGWLLESTTNDPHQNDLIRQDKTGNKMILATIAIGVRDCFPPVGAMPAEIGRIQ